MALPATFAEIGATPTVQDFEMVGLLVLCQMPFEFLRTAST